MSRKQISEYIFNRIKEAGVDCTFGIPGDFVLPLYAAQSKSGLRTVVMTHEPSVGFAADAYARLKGLGVALVTYGAGGLNMVNATGLAYAEESPLLVISGGPENKHRSQRALLHHCVKTFDTQNNVYGEVTAANFIITDVHSAKTKIDEVFETVQTASRPGYLELPRDLMASEIEMNGAMEKTNRTTLVLPSKVDEKVLQSICQRIRNAKQPVIMAGVQISRFNLLGSVRDISEVLNIPVVSSIQGKTAFPESHPNFIGIYFGQFGDEAVREFFESCDCIIAIGVVLNEMETGGFSAKLPSENLILINNEEIRLGEEKIEYKETAISATEQFKAFLSALKANITDKAKGGLSKKFALPVLASKSERKYQPKDNLSVSYIISAINKIVDNNTVIVCDVGDCLYAGLSIKTDCFIAPGYYSSMGFGVPAGIGVQVADRNKRPIVLVGDGGFQMTGTEISTAVKEGLSPIIIVFNNASYAMLKFIDVESERSYYKLPTWDYVGFAEALGAEGHRAKICGEFDLALQKALKTNRPVLIDAIIASDDISPTLKRLTELVGKKMRSTVVS